MAHGNNGYGIVACKDLTKRYGNNYVFRNASFNIGTGVTGLIAPNGFGKTTLVETLAGVRKNYTGEISIFGKTPDQAKQLIGFVADKPAFPRKIKVEEFLRIVCEIYGVEPDQDLIRLASIEKVLDARIGDLSAGYLKRLAFLIAVVHSPKIVLADEPFSNVDRTAVEVMQEMIRKLAESGTSFIISSHDLNELVNVADRMLIIDNQRLRDIQPEDRNKGILEIYTEDDGLLYELLRKDHRVKKGDRGLKVEYTDLKRLLGTLSLFEKEIISMKVLDKKERFLDEIYETIAKD